MKNNDKVTVANSNAFCLFIQQQHAVPERRQRPESAVVRLPEL